MDIIGRYIQGGLKYIFDKDISSDRLHAVGYGESRPVESNQSDAGRAQNRRVEFTLIKK